MRRKSPQRPRQIEPVPPGHDRRIDRSPGGELDRTGKADAHSDDVADAATGFLEEAQGRGGQPLHGADRARSDLALLPGLREQSAGQIRHRDPGMRGPEVCCDDDPGLWIEGELRAGASTRGDRIIDRSDETEVEELIDALRNRRAREPG